MYPAHIAIDGAIKFALDNKLKVVDLMGAGKKDEYYIFGFKKNKDQFLEYKKDQKGLPPAKNPLFKTRL